MEYTFVILSSLLNLSRGISIHLDLTSEENESSTQLKRFWTSTGLSPPVGEEREYLLSKDMELNMGLMGALPHQGLTHVRIHWLLNLVTLRTDGVPGKIYNFSDLDIVLHRLHKNGLYPGFELMGSPPNLKDNFPSKMQEWSNFLRTMIGAFKDQFGLMGIKKWIFETLNEPDLKQYNLWNLTSSEYIKYVQTSAEVLSSQGLKLWGPAGLFKDRSQHVRCWRLLDICNRSDCPISVLSFHKKGDGKASLVVKGGEDLIEEIYKKYPHMKKLPISNDEADPLTGWWRRIKWRADVRYGSAVAQTIIGYINMAQRMGVNIASISNDNGFLSNHPYVWDQRTLFARFKMNDSNPTLLKKPVYATMALLSLLGNITLQTAYNPGEPGLSYIATSEGNRRTVLLNLSYDNLKRPTTRQKKINLKIKLELPRSNSKRQGVIYLQDNLTTDPARLWRKAGSPSFPGKDLLRQLRKAGEPLELETMNLSNQEETVHLVLPISIPTVLLINICGCNGQKPGEVTELRYLNVTTNEILIVWNDEAVNTRCLLTYNVQYKGVNHTEFQTLSTFHFFTTSFHFDGCIPSQDGGLDGCMEENIEGIYKITPMDYCGLNGHPVHLTVY